MEEPELARELSASGMRMTRQRRRVYRALRERADHPTADEVYLRVRARGSRDISLATVYNTLDALVKCGLVRQVHLEREASRYCCNLEDHCHFHCEECGRVHDIEWNGDPDGIPVRVPEELKVRRMEISLQGSCRDPRNCPVRRQEG